MDTLFTMTQSVAIILLGTMLLSDVSYKFSGSFWMKGIVLGVMFSLIGLTVMQNAIELVAGTRTDIRLAVITLAGAIGGPLCLTITAVALVIQRLYFGGVGAVPGALTIIATAISAIVVWAWWTIRLGRIVNTSCRVPYDCAVI
jgi:hypothetical protein